MATGRQMIYESLMSRAGDAEPQKRHGPTRRVLDILEWPDRDFEFIHVTGTNGKSSTSRIASSILEQHGMKVGLFTSPHLVSFRERIVLNGTPISEEQLETVWAEVAAAIAIVNAELESNGSPFVTFFEALTCLAYTAFSRGGMDAAVIEVGIGGSWDATNVADGRVAVLTPISLDHVARLGATLPEIARAKAGIIKPGSTTIQAPQHAVVEEVLIKCANENNATVVRAGRDFEATVMDATEHSQTIRIDGPFSLPPERKLNLAGSVHAINAAVAVAASAAFLSPRDLDPTAVRAGLLSATSPGRMQTVSINPRVLLDAAHNPAGAEALVGALRALYPARSIAFLISVLNDKDARGIVRALSTVADSFFITDSGSIRATDSAALLDIAHAEAPTIPARRFSSPAVAMDAALAWVADDA